MPRRNHFVLSTPEEYARNHPDPRALLATLTAPHNDAVSGNTARENEAITHNMFRGLATRNDIDKQTILALLDKVDGSNWGILAALLNNYQVTSDPDLHAQVRDHIGSECIYTLLTNLTDPTAYIEDILLVVDDRGGMTLPNIKEHVRNAFSEALINKTLTDLVDKHIASWGTENDFSYRHSRLPQHSMLTPGHVATLARAAFNTISSATSGPGWGLPAAADSACHTVALLLARHDLSDHCTDLLFECILHVEDITDTGFRPFARFSIEQIINNSQSSNGRPTLRPMFFTRVLSTPSLVEHLLASPNFRGVTPSLEVVEEAFFRYGAPVRAITLFSHYASLSPVLIDHILDLMALAPSHPQGCPVEHREKVFMRLVDGIDETVIGTPEFTRLYRAWLDEGLPLEPFAYIGNRDSYWADESHPKVSHAYMAWAFDTDNSWLRADAVQHMFCVDHLNVAVNDDDPAVRLAAVSHRLITADMLTHLAGDSDPAIRLAVAEHPKVPTAVVQRLANDPDEKVRQVLGERTIALLKA